MSIQEGSDTSEVDRSILVDHAGISRTVKNADRKIHRKDVHLSF
jgi:hypothetical protein